MTLDDNIIFSLRKIFDDAEKFREFTNTIKNSKIDVNEIPWTKTGDYDFKEIVERMRESTQPTNQIGLAKIIIKHCNQCVEQKLKLTEFEKAVYAYAREFLDGVNSK